MSPSLSFPSTRARCPPWSSARVASPRVPETPPPQSRAPSSSPRSRTRPCCSLCSGRTPAPWRRLHRRHRAQRACDDVRDPARGVVVGQHVRREHHAEPIGGPIVRDVVPVERLDVREGRVLRDVLRMLRRASWRTSASRSTMRTSAAPAFAAALPASPSPAPISRTRFPATRGRTVGDEAREGDGGGPHDVTRAVERVAETLEVFTRDAIAGGVGDVRGGRTARRICPGRGRRCGGRRRRRRPCRRRRRPSPPRRRRGRAGARDGTSSCSCARASSWRAPGGCRRANLGGRAGRAAGGEFSTTRRGRRARGAAAAPNARECIVRARADANTDVRVAKVTSRYAH